MLAVILVDADFAKREREMLSRLEIGLADEGVRVVHALPLEMMGEDAGGLYSSAVGYEAKGMAISRRLRASRLLDAIQRALDLDERHVDVIHGFGEHAWTMAIEAARLSSAPVLLELSDAASVGAAAALAGRRVGVRPVEFCVPEVGLRRALRKRAHSAHVHVAPWGVHAPHVSAVRLRENRPLAVGMLSDGRDAAATRAALAGLAGAMSTRGELMIFAGTGEGKGGRDAAVWSAARELGVLDRLSLVPDMEARREPMLQMDMLLLPEAGGKQRTFVLDAMAAGVLVAARADELVEHLIDGRTARLVPRATPEAWGQAIAGLLDDAGGSAALRSSAHQFVRGERSASAQVMAVMTAYHAMVAATQVGVKM